jgi:MFS family permease
MAQAVGAARRDSTADAGGAFASLRHRNFRHLVIGQGFSQVGTWMTQMAATLLVLDLTKSGVAVGVLAACQFLPFVFAGPFAGSIAERWGRRRLMIAFQCCLMAQAVAYALLATMPAPPILAIFGVALAGGLVNGFEAPTRRAFVTDLVPTDLAVNAVSLNTAAMLAPRVVGPALAGLVIAQAGYVWCFAIDACSYAFLIASLITMRESELRPTHRSGAGGTRPFAVVPYVRSEPELSIPFAMLLVVGTLTFNFTVVLPLFATRALGGGNTGFTLLYAALSAGSLIGSLVAARKSTVTVRQIVLGAIALGTSLIALALAPTLGFACMLALLPGYASVMFMTTMTALVQVRASEEMRVPVLALQGMIMVGTTPIGGPLLGALSDAVGSRASVLTGGIAAMLAGAWGLRAERRWSSSRASEADAQPVSLTGADSSWRRGRR